MFRHHGGDEYAHTKSLTVYQLFNKLGGRIPIQFNLKGLTLYPVGQYSEHYVQYISSLIRQQIPPCYRSWKNVPEELRVSLLTQVEVK